MCLHADSVDSARYQWVSSSVEQRNGVRYQVFVLQVEEEGEVMTVMRFLSNL